MNCTFTLLFLYYLMIGFQRLGFIRTYWRDVFSLELSYRVPVYYHTLDLLGNQKRSAFRSLWALECLHFQSEIPWECGPHPNQNSCCIHNIHTGHFPLAAWCWWAKSTGVPGLGIFNQCTVPIDLNTHWVQKSRQAHQGGCDAEMEGSPRLSAESRFWSQALQYGTQKNPMPLSGQLHRSQRALATPPTKCQGHSESTLAQVSFNEFQTTWATSRRWVDSA